MSDYKMPFGKHKGKRLDQIDTGYLDWLVGHELKEPLKSELLAELESRPEWKDGSFDEDDGFDGYDGYDHMGFSR